MKYLILFFFTAPAFAATTSFDLIGSWKIDGFLYQETRFPDTLNELDLRYVFNYDHTAIITLARKSSATHCESHVRWELNNGTIVQNVIWVNPDNSPECANDPDIAPTATMLRTLGDEIALKSNAQTLPIFYVLSRDGRPGDLTHD